MKPKSKPKTHSPAHASLRNRAKTELQASSAALPQGRAAPDPERLLHEMRVHQIELEMQNEELHVSRAEAEAARARYQSLYEFAPVGYLSCDEEGIVTEANLACATLLRTVRSRLVGKEFFSFVARQDRPKGRALLARIFRGIPKESGELTLRGEDGFEFEAQLDAQFDAEGRECLAALADLTERKGAEAERLLFNKLQSTGIIADGIAHDFNNLLTAILVNLELSAEKSKAGREDEKYLRNAIIATERASELVRQFMTVASDREPLRQVADLSKLIAESVDLALIGFGVQGEIALDKNLWPVEVDVGQIGQVVRNLIQNAREAMPEGGTVTVRAANVRRDASERPKLAPGDYLRITVEDTGHGMPEKMIDKVFDPYFSTKRRGEQKGMGLGLSVSHSIIQRHGGSIRVASTVGQGSRFQVDLPASPLRHSAEEAARALAPMPPCRMLVVEDEAWIRVAMGESLRTMGHEVDLIEREGLAREIFAAAQNAGRP